MGKVHSKISLHKRGLGLKKDCIMHMRDLCHEYKGCSHKIRDWSLITGRGGGGYKTGGGAREVLPLRKGGGRKSFSHAEGGAHKVLG